MKSSLKSIWNKTCRAAALTDLYTPEPVVKALERQGWKTIVNHIFLPPIAYHGGPGTIADVEIISPTGVSSKKNQDVIKEYDKARIKAVRAYFDGPAPAR